MTKIIVAHPAQQHSFKTAEQLYVRNELYCYVTSIYLKSGTYTSKIMKFLNKENVKRARGRKSDLIPEKDIVVICEISGLILLALRRVRCLKLLYNIWWNIHNWRFNKKLTKIISAVEDLDAVILYDQVSSSFFKRNKEATYKKILDMSAPYFKEMYKIKCDNKPKIHQKANLATRYKEKYLLKNVASEISEADGFLVASNFTKETLLHHGIEESKIFKCVYGIEKNLDFYSRSKLNEIDSINLLYMGRYTLEKGAVYFSEVINILPKKYKIRVLGEYDEKSEHFKLIKDRAEFLGHLPKSEIYKVMKKTDYLVFPSLCDGFGLSVVEALTVGIPVICSENAGASELVLNGFNGFKYTAGNKEELLKILLKIEDKNYQELSQNAIESTRYLTWENYGNDLDKAMKKIIGE